MSRAAAVPTTILVAFLGLLAGGAVLALQNGEAALGNNIIAVFSVPFGFVGMLLVWRRPLNRVGWVMTAVALSFALWFIARQYAVLALVTRPGSLPGGVFMLWSTQAFADIGWALAFTFLPLLFPDGRVPSSRWRPFAWAAAALVVFNVLQGQIFVPARIVNVPLSPGSYPFGLEPRPDLRARLLPIAYVFFYGPVIVGSFAAPLVRFRTASAVVRQQLKWFIFAAGLLFVGLVIDEVPVAFSPNAARGGFGTTGTPVDLVSVVLLVAALLAIPLAIGIAILRYHLYDIDLIIRRTLVYGALTVVLALTYAAVIAAVQAVLRSLTGGSELAVAASTLSTLALAQPLRRRIQVAVDRRFYRSRYDAAQTLDAFTGRMRDQVDIDAVRAEVLDVVGASLRPAHASVWLRPPLDPRNDFRTSHL